MSIFKELLNASIQEITDQIVQEAAENKPEEEDDFQDAVENEEEDDFQDTVENEEEEAKAKEEEEAAAEEEAEEEESSDEE